MNKESELTTAEQKRYARHLTLPEVGVAGQKKLKAARVLVIGAGGLGCPALQYLTAAGVGTIGIVDFDAVDESNLQRQILFTVEDCGKKKAEVAARRLSALNPHIKIVPTVDRFSPGNAAALIRDFDLVLDGSDNFATRYLINDACVSGEKTFISGSLTRFSGQVGVFNHRFKDGRWSATYRCLFPTPPAPEDAPDCNAAGVLGVLPGMIGTIQATEALKWCLGIGDLLADRVLLLDALTMRTRILNVQRDEKAAASAKILSESEYKNICGVSSMNAVKTISAKELKAKLDSGEEIVLIDVREPFERAIANIGGELIPMRSVLQNLDKIPRDKMAVIYCHSGMRSGTICETLQRQHGYTKVFNLAGGVTAWADEIDPTMQKY